ncbi:hypothetical protein PVK06_023770 [Gossypium arboreum]|uniref:Uncharacterized protein n=1 Tax=Gossypium arboreum TaxID=29729 RepID=A0ABR0PC08_GOSAR|nr:hypothetical protein PVK06_023770 [Gossypium arboreum]
MLEGIRIWINGIDLHVQFEECTITLEDVTLQLGQPIDGSAVTSASTMFESIVLCYHLLGHSLGDGGDKFKSLRFSWLKVKFRNFIE